jgi:LPXTG-site transpeptidase (sortase) family protein
VLQNQRGDTLANSVTWRWTGNMPLVTAAPVVAILEPAMQITKTVSPTVALPGSVVVYEIRISHLVPPSNTDAYDVEVRDTVPRGVTYIPGTLAFVSGVAPTTLDETAAPLLRIVWDSYPLGSPETVLRFAARVWNLQPGMAINNTASVAWTSTPGIPPSAPGAPAGQQSIYNDYSFERRYDPLFPADIYGVSDSAAFTVPALPDTGFAPDRVTVLPDQPADQAYADLGNLWLEIPSLGVKVSIVGIPVKGSGWDLTWLSNQTGYLDGTAYPTHSGNSVLTAHVYLPDGSPGPFVNLSSMYWGQQVIVHMDGQRYIYEVREVRRIWPDDLSVMRHEDKPWLTLLTCKEFDTTSGTYRYRISVRAVLLRVEPESASSGAKK